MGTRTWCNFVAHRIIEQRHWSECYFMKPFNSLNLEDLFLLCKCPSGTLLHANQVLQVLPKPLSKACQPCKCCFLRGDNFEPYLHLAAVSNFGCSVCQVTALVVTQLWAPAMRQSCPWARGRPVTRTQNSALPQMLCLTLMPATGYNWVLLMLQTWQVICVRRITATNRRSQSSLLWTLEPFSAVQWRCHFQPHWICSSSHLPTIAHKILESWMEWVLESGRCGRKSAMLMTIISYAKKWWYPYQGLWRQKIIWF